jgi:peptidyl-prolyl cis-trans isomerase SurA
MRKIILLILTLIININVYSQDNLLEIENESISLDEFNNIFNKNNDNQVIDKKYLDEYIELFINFKLKVREAKELGYDTLSTFIDELEGYRKQLAKPYLRDDQFNEEMFDEALERVQYDLNASHILININDENNDIALSRINNIRREIINNNISFEEAAIKYSSKSYPFTFKVFPFFDFTFINVFANNFNIKGLITFHDIIYFLSRSSFN